MTIAQRIVLLAGAVGLAAYVAAYTPWVVYERCRVDDRPPVVGDLIAGGYAYESEWVPNKLKRCGLLINPPSPHLVGRSTKDKKTAPYCEEKAEFALRQAVYESCVFVAAAAMTALAMGPLRRGSASKGE